MRFVVTLFILIFSFSFLFSQIYISEISDASGYQNEFLELYNNSSSAVDLTGYKLIRVNASTNASEYVFDIGTDEAGASDVVIPAYGFMVIARGNDRTTFESEWTNLPGGAAFNTGNTNLYFGTGTARRWRLRGNDGTANTDDGSLIDDTGQAVAGSGNRHYQKSIGGPWILDNYSNATPGYFDADQSLPVTLAFFSAKVVNQQVYLRWRTESEVNNLGFEIYRANKQDGDYQLVSSFRSNEQLKGQINSSSSKLYQFVDANVLPNQTYFYKLADVSIKGQRSFHGPVKVLVNQNTPQISVGANTIKRFELYPNFPNPFNPSTTITFDVPQLSKAQVAVTLSVFNLNGQKVRTLTSGLLQTNAQYQVRWDGTNDAGQNLPAGIYLVLLQSPQFQKSIKVCLLK